MSRIPTPLLLMAMTGRTDLADLCQRLPQRTGPKVLTDADRERMQAAADKRRRKLERYTNTPEARARRAETERQAATWQPLAMPPPSDDFIP